MKNFLLKSSAAFAVLSIAAFAQQDTQSLSGTFVLVEEGSGVSQSVASLALLNFLSGGTVAGIQVVRSPGSTFKKNVQGTYVLNNDGTGSLILNSLTSGNEDNAPVVTSVNYHLRMAKSRGITAIPTDTGLFSIAVLSQAGPAGPLKGGFIFAERGNGSPYAGLGLLTLDGANAVSGTERVATVGVNAVYNLTGTYGVDSDGFGSMILNIPSTDLDGNPTSSAASYIFLSSAGQVYAIRTDANTAFVSTLTAVQ